MHMSLALQAYIVLLVAALNIVLAGVVLAQNVQKRINMSFALLALVASLWGVGTSLFLYVVPTDTKILDFLGRLNYFSGEMIPIVFLYFALTLNTTRRISKKIILLVFSTVPLMFVLYFFTDLIISGVTILDSNIRGFTYGPMSYLFLIHVWGYFGIALVILIKKLRIGTISERRSVLLVIGGTYATLAVASVANIILPHFYSIFKYIAIGPSALVVWIGTIAYGIARLNLFSVRLVAAELVVSLLWISFVFRTFTSIGETRTFFINIWFLAAILILGVFLIRSIIIESEQRSILERQESDIADINKQQSALLYFLSHEIKSYFTKIEAAFASIWEGDYGVVPAPLLHVADTALTDVRVGKAMVLNVLNASDLKNGKVSYSQSPFDVSRAVSQVVQNLQSAADEKNLALNVRYLHTNCIVIGDEEKVREHVIYNLVDNAIRYTLAGSISVTVDHTEKCVRVVVEDTGVGITPDDMSRLFTEGGHGENSISVNVHSTGYGLYIAKQIVDAHGGLIYAKSDGAGKGSRFVVQLPLANS